MRLTYKILASLVEAQFKKVEIDVHHVEAYNPRHRGDDIEGGACLTVFRIFINAQDWFTMFGFQWRSDIEDIVNSKNYKIIIKEPHGGMRGVLNDGEIEFVSLNPKNSRTKK